MKPKNFIRGAIIIFLIFFTAMSVIAHEELIDLHELRKVALPLSVLELFFAVFISFISLKFFRITKPINLFLIIYIAIGNNKDISYHLKKVASATFRINKEFIDECKLEK